MQRALRWLVRIARLANHVDLHRVLGVRRAEMLCSRVQLIVAAAMVSLSLGPGLANAQPVRSSLVAAASMARDLEMPTEVSELGPSSVPKMALHKPAGTGPFPALVLHHQCGGLRYAANAWQNMSVLEWARESVARGYVVLVLDSLGPRSVDSVCMGARGGVNLPRGVRDALQGARHLSKLPYVDPKRIAFIGFSWGAMVGLLSSGASWGGALASGGQRFRAVVSLYPGCFEIRPPNGLPFQVLNSDIDTPLLVLLGEADVETPPHDCTSRLEPLKAAGQPVDWHMYPEATHCWDCENLNGFRKTDIRGTAVEYRYNQAVSKDSVDRAFGFFSKVWGN